MFTLGSSADFSEYAHGFSFGNQNADTTLSVTHSTPVIHMHQNAHQPDLDMLFELCCLPGPAGSATR